MGKQNSTLKPSEMKDFDQATYEEQSLQGWYKTYSKDTPDGKMNEKALIDIYSDLFPDGDATAFAKHVFRTFDVDGDGSIDFREFLSAVAVTSKGSYEQKMQWAFSLYDLDGSGSITRKEIISVVKAVYKLGGKNLKLAEDENTPEKRTDKIMKQMNKGPDDKISVQEFVDFASKDHSVVDLITNVNK